MSITLKERNDGQAEIVFKGTTRFVGSFEDARRVATEALGVIDQEFCVAMESMERYGHNYASFGINGTFIFSQSEGQQN